MIPKKYAPQAFSFFMALLMSCVMSLMISLINLGLVDGLALLWLRAWALAFVIAFPCILLVTPLVRKLAALVLVKD